MNKIKIALLLALFLLSYSISCNTYTSARVGGGFRGGLNSGDRNFESRDDFAHNDDYLHGDDAYSNRTRLYDRPFAGHLNADADHVITPVSANDLESRANAVRNNYAYTGLYNKNFWAAHPEAEWAYASRWGDNWAWGYTGWPALAGFWGMPIDMMPTEYAYGNNITYQNGNVYYGSQPLETTAAYYGQAQNLSQSIPVFSTEINNKNKWKPLGVFSMVQGEQTNTNTMFQLAVNKNGAIKGSYYNPLTGETKAVKGAVDKKNMRASWIVGDDKDVVYDTGLNNLLQAQSQMLVHYGKDKTQQWTLVRLEQPKTT